MAKIKLQNLDRFQKIVKEDGTPSDFFIRFIQDRGGGLTELDALVTLLEGIVEAVQTEVDALEAVDIVAGDYLSGGGVLGGGGPITLDHDASGVTPDTYGDATNVPQLTVDEFGHVTSVTEVPISGGGGGSGLITYSNQNNTSGSTGTTPSSMTAVISATIPASGTARTFLVGGNISWRDGGHAMRGGVMLDSAQVWPNIVGSNQGVDPISSVDGLNWLVYSGVLVTVPGDGAAHTISLAWESSGSTGSITIENRQITCVQLTGSGSFTGPWWFNPPTAASMTLASGDATNLILTDDVDAGLLIDCGAPVNGDLSRIAYRTLTNKALDWDMVVKAPIQVPNTGSAGAGMYIYDSISGRSMSFEFRQDGTIYLTGWNPGLVGYGGVLIIGLALAVRDNVWWRVQRVGANNVFSISVDGKQWTILLTQSVTAYLPNAADRVGFGSNTNRTSAVRNLMNIQYFTLTGPGV